MKIKVIWIMLSLLISLLLVFTSCTPETTPTPTSTAKPTTAPTATATVSANWWDDLGEPGYGGTIIRRTTAGQIISIEVDQWNRWMGADLRLMWAEKLFAPDWDLDRKIFAYNADWTPPDYVGGSLAESWEQPDPQTLVVTIHQGVHWRDIPPVNGREFTAGDVQYNYERIMGMGSFTEPNPFYASGLQFLESAVATGPYTVEFKLKDPSILVLDSLYTNSSFGFVAPEWVEQGDLQNWETAIGTGPWIMTDWEPSVSATFSRNPDYWGTDERYPENQLPYADELRCVSVDDMSTSLAALRTGQIDTLLEREGPSLQQVESLIETHPDIQVGYWLMAGLSLAPRCDIAPFNDLRVRKAMQLAVDLESIAQSYYSGAVSGTPSGFLHPVYSDWTTPYEQWPAELQAEYTYDQERAKELLAEAGYPGGLEISCIVGDVFDLSLMQVVKANLMDVGIDMAIDVYDMPTFNSLQQTGTYDMCFSALSGITAGTDGLASFTTGHWQNYVYNNDPTFDAMYYDMLAATSMDEAKMISKEMDRYALENHWLIVTIPRVNAALWQPWIKGYSGEITQGGGQYLGFYYSRFWVDQDLKASLED